MPPIADFELVRIAPGQLPYDIPCHDTTAFALMVDSVNQQQWQSIYADFAISEPLLPMIDISKTMALDFIDKLNAKYQSNFRLPTRREWEYAARAGDPRKVANDAKLFNLKTHYNHKHLSLCATGSNPLNDFGLRDMLGNVWEWVSDVNGFGQSMVKGGCWASHLDALHYDYASCHPADEIGWQTIGLRLARDVC